ncbi:PAS domain S-box protein [Saccharopolyspora mangrovi]|uniref:PAS domain S-box protein n=1 Tax=Saccharopolyspora mangrovi TaxID=3082379 RepID=A0ABU6A4U5_9PSEU|nr:PAS domain S-box protein [Saccharopolyspora sp. S2-29]MEB3366454.1 PAS domain S-box protein [Saccharopolyspora sp. S2-29]
MATPGSAMPDNVTWQLILEQAAAPVAALDLQARIIYANPAACDLLGYDPAAVLNRPAHDFTHPDDPPVDHDMISSLVTGDAEKLTQERRGIRSDGTALWVLVDFALIRDADGVPQFVLAQYQDITERRTAERRWRHTFANAPIGMAMLDLTGRWLEVNDKLCDMVGYTRDEMLTMRFTDLTYPHDTAGLDLLADLAAGRIDTASTEKRYRHKAGYPIWALIRVNLVRGADDQPAYLVSQYETIGDEEMRDSHIAHMALHDPLTGLANRALLMDRLNHELAALHQHGGVLTVLLADLDGLKPVNDRYGHAAGDNLLTTTADELLNAVQPGDTVARLGGDEFVVVSNKPDINAAKAFRDEVSRCLNTDITVSGHEITLTASIGLAATTNATTPASDLLHAADLDMYTHKATSPRHQHPPEQHSGGN